VILRIIEQMYWKMVRKVSKGGAVSANGVRNLEEEVVWDEGESRECRQKYFMKVMRGMKWVARFRKV
jgi:hypothetical protein